MIVAKLGFAPAEDVSLDTLRSGGVLRAKTRALDGYAKNAVALRDCRITDTAEDNTTLQLETMGFDRVDLSGFAALQERLERVRVASSMTEEDARALRKELQGRSVRLSDRKRLRFVYVAPEGIILRKAGPNGLVLDPKEAMTKTSGHGPATNVHADQDVRGTPVRQLLRGMGPRLFRHDAPDGANTWSPVFLVNLWIPLQQITYPLALMDQRSLDRKKHQLRYGLPVEGFLDRSEEMRVNDIWSFLPDDAQRWYFTSELSARQAYVFNTLSTPHGAFVVPGEEIAERFYLQLRSVCVAIEHGVPSAVRAASEEVSWDPASVATEPLRKAIEAMVVLLARAKREAEALCATSGAEYREEAARAMDRVVRKSVEFRLVAVLTPSWT